MAERFYYQISERDAKLSHDMMSMRDYTTGSATAEYRQSVDKAYDMADKVAEKKPRYAGKAYRLAGKYARRLADWTNRENRIGTMCPSIMVSGGSNFPVRKKQKQFSAWEANHKQYEEITAIFEQITNLLYHQQPILSSDEDAVEQLEEKLEALTEEQETMKAVNAYCRKNHTLDGCPDLTEARKEALERDIARGFCTVDRPYRTWQLSNNNANIRRIQERIDTLKKEKETGTTEAENDFCTVVENKELMRLQLIFDGKPDAETRGILKHNGFRWSPSNSAWQRQLTDNARYAAKRAIEAIKASQEPATEEA